MRWADVSACLFFLKLVSYKISIMNPNNKLIEKFQSGDEEAFKTIKEMFWGDLLEFAEGLSRDGNEGLKIVTGTFEVLKRRKEVLDSLVDIRAFLYIGVRNKCLAYLKSIRS
jgi:hypothetical protein